MFDEVTPESLLAGFAASAAAEVGTRAAISRAARQMVEGVNSHPADLRLSLAPSDLVATTTRDLGL